MKTKVFVHFIDGDRSCDSFQVRFEVGNQSFDIGPEWDTKEEARFHARMFRRALKNSQK